MTSCRFHPDARQLPPITIIDADGRRHEGVVICVACEMGPKCPEASTFDSDRSQQQRLTTYATVATTNAPSREATDG